MSVPKRFWAEAVMAVVFFINRMVACIIGYQILLRMLSHFHTILFALNLCPKVFGYVCYVHVHYHHKDKFVNENLILWGMYLWFLFRGR